MIEFIQKLYSITHYSFIYLDHMNVSTGIPDLGSGLTVPSEGQNILSSLQGLRNLHQVLECPGVIMLWVVRKVNLGPL